MAGFSDRGAIVSKRLVLPISILFEQSSNHSMSETKKFTTPPILIDVAPFKVTATAVGGVQCSALAECIEVSGNKEAPQKGCFSNKYYVARTIESAVLLFLLIFIPGQYNWTGNKDGRIGSNDEPHRQCEGKWFDYLTTKE